MKNYSLSVWCCPTDRLSESWKIGVLRGSKVSKASTCCPTESKQIAQINFAPERRTQQREESGKGVIPAVTLHEIRRQWKKGLVCCT
jgi:hypothetical protein